MQEAATTNCGSQAKDDSTTTGDTGQSSPSVEERERDPGSWFRMDDEETVVKDDEESWHAARERGRGHRRKPALDLTR